MPTRAEEVYKKVTRRKKLLALASWSLVAPLFLLDVMVGPSSLGLPSGELGRVVLWSIRLPVALAALLGGASLALAGSLIQTILDNPLASPYTLGISAGAAFGAALAYVFGVSLLGSYSVVTNAFAFAILTSVIVFALSKAKGMSAESLVLAGIAINYLFHSLLAFSEFVASEEALQAVVFWTFGSLYKATWGKLTVLASALVPSFFVALALSWRLSALKAGEEVARGAGVDVGKLRALSFVLASLLTATVVCYFGIIAFVGLVAPHLARMIVGEDQRFSLVASAAAGSALLLAADVASKTVVWGAIVPIGIVTSFVGVPFFLFLMLRR